MIKNYTVLFVLLFSLLYTGAANSQLLLSENFSYPDGTALTSNGWTPFLNLVNPILVGTNNGLSYTGYVNSGIGNAAIIQGDGEDVYRSFSSQSVGSVYVSFLVSMTTPRAGGNFFGLLTSAPNLLFRYLRVYAKAVTGGWSLGLAKSLDTPAYGSSVLALDTTYLVVLKYTFVIGAANDIVTGYVFKSPTLPDMEPAVSEIGPLNPSNPDPANVGGVVLRQDLTVPGSETPDLIIDGIRVGNTWNDAPLPVELSSFNITTFGRDIQLNWSTKTEKNSNKFVIQRNNSLSWVEIGSVKASVLSNSPKYYSYADKNLQPGKYQYRLKMIDNDATFQYSSVIEAVVEVPKEYSLMQNYPNPFNPSTVINYSIPQDGKVTLKVFDITGKEAAELVNENQRAGTYSINFDARRLTSGVYFYSLGSGSFIAVKKLMIIK